MRQPESLAGASLTSSSPERTGVASARLPSVPGILTADQVLTYLASYGKDLPNPRKLMVQAIFFTAPGELVEKGKRPPPEEWKKIRAFTIREVTWQLDGLDCSVVGAAADANAATESVDRLVVVRLHFGTLAERLARAAAGDRFDDVFTKDPGHLLVPVVPDDIRQVGYEGAAPCDVDQL